MTTKNKRNALDVLRERKRKRALIPPVVLQRRKRLTKAENPDPAAVRLNAANRLTLRHRKVFEHLMMRQMALVNTPAALRRMLDNEGLTDIKLDSGIKALLENSIRKVSEVLIFKLVLEELVNDKVLRDKMLELFVEQRFEGMRPKTAQSNKPSTDQKHNDPVMQQLQSMLQSIIN